MGFCGGLGRRGTNAVRYMATRDFRMVIFQKKIKVEEKLLIGLT